VTGSATGIGAAIAITFAQAGANVVINYTKSKAEAEATAELARERGAEVRIVSGDVAKDEDCRRLAQAALDAWDGSTFSSTMPAPPNSPHIMISTRWTARTSPVSTRSMSSGVPDDPGVPRCVESGRRRRVVNISSIAGTAGVGSSVAYAASKARSIR